MASTLIVNHAPLRPSRGNSHPFQNSHFSKIPLPLSSASHVSIKTMISSLYSWAYFCHCRTTEGVPSPALYNSSSKSSWLMGKLLKASFLKPCIYFCMMNNDECINIVLLISSCLNLRAFFVKKPQNSLCLMFLPNFSLLPDSFSRAHFRDVNLCGCIPIFLKP